MEARIARSDRFRVRGGVMFRQRRSLRMGSIHRSREVNFLGSERRPLNSRVFAKKCQCLGQTLAVGQGLNYNRLQICHSLRVAS
jgi:hypothetical protein